MARAIASRAIAAGIQVQLLAHEDKAKADALSSDLGGQVSTGVAGGAKVVKAFNTTFAGTLTGGQVAGQQLDVLIAGDDELAVKAVSDFAAAGGLNPIVVGPLRRAQQLVQAQFLHMLLSANEQLPAFQWNSALKFHPAG